jgi:ADP-dependent NAD(P)H-hydrate dehydratase / NAD(P)H-hydrate epimerase
MNRAPEMQNWHGAGTELQTVGQTRALEKRLLASHAKGALMQAAGLATARLYLALSKAEPRIWVAAGPGNNGGDGLVAARLLHVAGFDVRVSLVNGPCRPGSEAASALQDAIAAGVSISADACPPPNWSPNFGVDALLGLGQNRALDGCMAAAAQGLNALTQILAIDIPTGLNADTGARTSALAVCATHTLSLLTLKPGQFTAQGRDHCGQIWLHRLAARQSNAAHPLRLCGQQDAHAVAATRQHASHKGNFGEVLVIGGAPGMSGAAVLAAQAASAAGPGKVFLSLLDEGVPLLNDRHPEWMLRSRAWLNHPELLAQATVVCGCGGGSLVSAALSPVLDKARRLVLDADALNQMANHPTHATGWQTQLRVRAANGLDTVLTPHPLEAARLLGCTTAKVQVDRLSAARELAQKFQAVVLLKGSGTVLADPNGEVRINPSGNARLAVAGSGDVLAGWMGGLWASAAAQHRAVAPLDIAAAAAWQHGLAAEAQVGADTLQPPLNACALVSLLRA